MDATIAITIIIVNTSWKWPSINQSMKIDDELCVYVCNLKWFFFCFVYIVYISNIYNEIVVVYINQSINQLNNWHWTIWYIWIGLIVFFLIFIVNLDPYPIRMIEFFEWNKKMNEMNKRNDFPFWWTLFHCTDLISLPPLLLLLSVVGCIDLPHTIQLNFSIYNCCSYV